MADDNQPEYVREQDLLLPVANINRIMRKMLSENSKITRDAIEVVQACVSEFIGFITSESSDRLQMDKRKTITGDDIVDSLRTLGFDCFVPCMQAFLEKIRKQSHKNIDRFHSQKRSKHEDEEIQVSEEKGVLADAQMFDQGLMGYQTYDAERGITYIPPPPMILDPQLQMQMQMQYQLQQQAQGSYDGMLSDQISGRKRRMDDYQHH